MHSTTKPLAASLLAKWFIARVGQDPEQDLSNLKLQKLLFLAHSRFLHDFGSPLVSERFEAWDHGPVIEVLYRECSMFEDRPVNWALSADGPWAHLDERVSETLEVTWRDFGGYSAPKLREITHKQGPWKDVYKRNVKHIVIPNSEIGKAWVAFSRLSEASVPASSPAGTQAIRHYQTVFNRLPAQPAQGDPAFLLEELDSLEELRKHAASQIR